MTAPTNTRQTILDRLSPNPEQGLTAREISDDTGVKYATVTEHLRNAEQEGLVRKEKSGRQITWTRVPADQQQHPAATGDTSATGARVVDEQQDESGPVPVREDPEPSQTAVDASEALAVTTPAGDAGSAATVDLTAASAPVEPIDLDQAGSVSDVAAFMEQQRPIPDAPTEAEKATRTRSAGPAREVRNDFGSGGLQGEVLRYMDEHRNEDGSYKEYGPYELAVSLKAHASSVAYSLKQTTKKGQTVKTSEQPPRFRLLTKEEAADAAARTRAENGEDATNGSGEAVNV